MSAHLAAVGGVEAAVNPRVALRVADPLRRRALERALVTMPEHSADVLVLELEPGQTVPADVSAFEGGLLVLSDDDALAAGDSFAGVLPRSATSAQIMAAVAAVAEGLVGTGARCRQRPGRL